MIARSLTLAGLTLIASGCGEPRLAPSSAPVCQASEEAFVLQALPWLQGRRPTGIRELRLLADLIRSLDRQGVDGRRIVAEGLARGPRYERRWSTFLTDHVQVDRAGHRARPNCHVARGLPDDRGELAAWIRDRGPEDAMPGAPAWTWADLVRSSLALDDLSPLMRGHLLLRADAPIDGNNVSPEELESARRREFGASFSAVHLGRGLDCLDCHNSESSVTDRVDPAQDRFWPLDVPFERAVLGAPNGRDPAEVEAVFRVAGAVDGPLLPWGSGACSTFQTGHAGDPLGVPAYLAGPLPAGASVLDLEPRLRAGWASLRDTGWDGLDREAPEPGAALAAMTASHLADAVWRAMGGHPLTLAHGFPRSAAQRDILDGLVRAFVDEGFSLRAVVVAAALHPQLALDLPTACDALGVAPPAVLAPFAVHEQELAARGDSLGDLLHRHDAFTLLDMAADAMGWAPPITMAGAYGLPDEPMLLDLGARISSAQPGHEGLDLVALLTYEATVGAGIDPGWAGEPPRPSWPEGDLVDVLLTLAHADPGASVEDLVVALKDRLHTDPALLDEDRVWIEAVLGASLTAPVADVDLLGLQEGLRALAGALLRAPQFMLVGAVEQTDARIPAPRLVVPGTDSKTLCADLAPQILDEQWRWRCGPDGIELTVK